MKMDLKFYNGQLKEISRIPDNLKELYSTAFELDVHWLIEAGARRQKWIDQAQSLNLYITQPSGILLDNLYTTAWSRGLKTTYYLRSLAATDSSEGSEPEMQNSTGFTVNADSTEIDSNQKGESKKHLSSTPSMSEAVQKVSNTFPAKEQNSTYNDRGEFKLPKQQKKLNICSLADPECEACQ